MILLYNVHLLFKANSSNMHIFRGISSISCYQNPQFLALSIGMFIPIEKLTYLSSITKKGEIVSASSAP